MCEDQMMSTINGDNKIVEICLKSVGSNTIVARLRNHNLTDDGNIDSRSFKKIFIKLTKSGGFVSSNVVK